MGISARTNEPGQHIFSDLFTSERTTTGFLGDRTESWEEFVFAQYCERPVGGSGPILNTINHARGPTDWGRVICEVDNARRHRTVVYIDERDGRVVATDTGSYPLNPPIADIAAQSGGWLQGYKVIADDEASNQAITQAMNKLGDQKVNISASLAEVRGTLSMIADTSISLMTSYKALKARNWKYFADSFGTDFLKRDLYRKVLEVKYGWLPLMQDLHGSYEWMADNDHRDIKVSAESSATRHHGVEGSTSYGMSWQGSSTHISYCKVYATISGEWARSANKGGLINPASLAWEITPYSFVLDWFVPIGNVLQAYSDTAGLTFLTGYVGNKNECEVDVSYDASDGYRITDTGEAKVRYMSHSRSRLSDFPRPGLYAKEDPFNMGRASTALALYAANRRR